MYQIPQQTTEWFTLRKLKFTASHAQAIGNNGKGLETLVDELMSCHLSSATQEAFSSDHTDRGNELEEVARGMYELDREVRVEQVGFIEAEEHIGFSPDGLVGEDGLLEIKCPQDIIYYRLLRDGETQIDTKYLWQVQMALLISGRAWADLVFYNPNFKESMLIFRITPDEAKHQKLIEGLEKGVSLIKRQLAQFS